MIEAAINDPRFWGLFWSKWFWSGMGAWFVASFGKMVFAYIKTREVDFRCLVSTGGMPSSHSASVSGVFFGVGYTEGFQSPIAAVACAFAVVTMFDAATVRRAAGEHAKILNAIVRDIKELRFKPRKRFKELLGHTRTEVIWGFLTGWAWATLLCYVWD